MTRDEPHGSSPPVLVREDPASARQVRQTLVANGVLAGLGVASGLAIARVLGPSGRGVLAAAQLWPTSFATVAMLGMPEALVYFTARRPVRAGSVLASSMVLALFASVVFAVLGYFLMPVLLSAQAPSTIRLARLYLLIGPIYALVLLPPHPLRGLGNFRLWNMLRVLPSLLWTAIVAASVGLGSATPRLLLVSFLIALAASALVVYPVVWRSIRRPFRPRARFVPSLLRFGIPTAAASLPQILNLRLDQMVMVSFLPSRELGLYVVAVAWAGVPMTAVSAIGLVLFPRVAAKRDAVSRAESCARAARLTLIIGGLAAVMLGASTPALLPLILGDRFRAAVAPALILVGAGVALSQAVVVQAGARGLGFPRIALVSEGVAVLGTLALLAILLGPFGIIGAAVSSLGAYTVSALVTIAATSRLSGLPTKAFFLPESGDLPYLRRSVSSIFPGAKRR